jgi:hypothetical protein
MIHYIGRQMQTGCESAALAGAPELMDRTPLYPAGLRYWLETGGEVGPEPAIAIPQLELARQGAQSFAAWNTVGGRPFAIDPNTANDAAGDVVVGWVADPTTLGDVLLPWQGTGPINSLLVRARRTDERGNPITLWVGRLLGLPTVDLTTSARATVDQRVYGFRPSGHVRVPILPIVAVATGDRMNAWIQQASREASSHNDRITCGSQSGELFSGADGIPEIVLNLAPPSQRSNDDNAMLVSFGLTPVDPSTIVRQIFTGYQYEDLIGLGGQVSLLRLGRLWLPEQADTAVWDVTLAACQRIIGRTRILMLGEAARDEGCQVIGFAAGTVVDAKPLRRGGMSVVMQPSLLITCTALTGERAERNPWLGKLMLTE